MFLLKCFLHYSYYGYNHEKEWHNLDYFLETIELVEGFDDSCPHTRDFSRELGHA